MKLTVRRAFRAMVLLMLGGMVAVLMASCGSPNVPQSEAPANTEEMEATTVPGTSTTTVQSTTTTTGVSAATIDDFVGQYRGKVLRDDEPGTPETWHLVQVDISKDEGALTGTLTSGPVTANTLERFGAVVMPLEIIFENGQLRMLWNESVGQYEDTTFAQCEWETWDMRFQVNEGGRLLVLTDGHVDGQPPESSEVTEWWAGCPADERTINRATLVRQ